MATNAEIEFVLNNIQASYPESFFKMISERNAGVGAVLKYLYESHTPVTAGSISEYMQVSTARVAVLLRKMNAQGLIIKHEDKNDARVIIVQLSEKGEEKAVEMRTHVYKEIEMVINKVGMDRLADFFTISNEIQKAIAETQID